VTEENKARIDTIRSLYERSWEQFNKRRDNEFKITIALWTAMAVGVAGVARLEKIAMPAGRWAPVLLAFFAFILHFIWCRGIGKAQWAERTAALHYSSLLQKMARASFDDKFAYDLKRMRQRNWVGRNWTYVFQLGVTFLLGVALVLVSWKKLG
jgi:hypothetical protein